MISHAIISIIIWSLWLACVWVVLLTSSLWVVSSISLPISYVKKIHQNVYFFSVFTKEKWIKRLGVSRKSKKSTQSNKFYDTIYFNYRSHKLYSMYNKSDVYSNPNKSNIVLIIICHINKLWKCYDICSIIVRKVNID